MMTQIVLPAECIYLVGLDVVWKILVGTVRPSQDQEHHVSKEGCCPVHTSHDLGSGIKKN